ncbi:heterokaryon incompatibility protein-domain-containing protein [Podospora aff. communis PSN243]|uniref:Heterokaryon incompatibility protein-domain-containing protein n=1 Tax=Podospora aff. communis PSN243 TaxID=3040156 RepID=A0AAV9H168_9PEZI|nr:heterokaryon incompatibility protein-domain-containing protein [Podospora aff. communis PSN243]
MRLIDVHTYRLHEFFGSRIPQKYAILSHTWGDEEVTFQDLQADTGASWRRKKGYAKIKYTCREAKAQGLDWAWIDTCCIDKASSSELSEAINSMYAWYAKSTVCFAYLEDVLDDTDNTHTVVTIIPALNASRWFSRGWTLQELIAPPLVLFYSAGWISLGNRRDHALLLDFTGIPRPVLTHTGQADLDSYSVAQRMSWASRRQTTREEDMAYCLMGIFGINMPLLYGEGMGAFQRLQEEIIKQTDDHSLLCWTVDRSDPTAWSLGGALAPSPRNFLAYPNVVVAHGGVGEPSSMTNRGLHIDAPLVPLAFSDTCSLHNYSTTGIYNLRGLGCRLFQLVLNCVADRAGQSNRVVLWVLKKDSAQETDGRQFHRVLVPGMVLYEGSHNTQVGVDPIRMFRVRNNDFRRIYVSTRSECLSPLSSPCIHFHGIPLSHSQWSWGESFPSRTEPLWAERWCLLSHPEIPDTQYQQPGPACQRRYRFISDENLLGSFHHPDQLGPAKVELWRSPLFADTPPPSRRFRRQGLHFFTVVGDPTWDEYPLLIWGAGSPSGLICWLAPHHQPYSNAPLWYGHGHREFFVNSLMPPVLFPNSQTGAVFLIEAKCGHRIINIVMYLESDQTRERYVNNNHSQPTDSPGDRATRCLLIFRQFSMSSPPAESTAEDGPWSGGPLSWEDPGRRPWNVDLDMHSADDMAEPVAEMPPGNVKSDREGFTYMPFELMDRGRREVSAGDKSGRGGKLEWCKVFAFDNESDTLTLQGLMTYYDEGVKGDGSAEKTQPIARPPRRERR